MRELNPSGFLAPSSILLSPAFVCSCYCYRNSVRVQVRVEAPGSGKARGPGNTPKFPSVMLFDLIGANYLIIDWESKLK